MKAQGPAVVLNAIPRGSRISPTPGIKPGSAIEPIMVHETIDEQGKLQE